MFYAAPEILIGQDPTFCDIWSFALVVHTLILVENEINAIPTEIDTKVSEEKLALYAQVPRVRLEKVINIRSNALGYLPPEFLFLGNVLLGCLNLEPPARTLPPKLVIDLVDIANSRAINYDMGELLLVVAGLFVCLLICWCCGLFVLGVCCL